MNNPEHNVSGDFALDGDIVLNSAQQMYTFSGIGYYSPEFFRDVESKKSALAPLLRNSIEKREISGELFTKMWHDIGTPKRLEEVNNNE